jgi:tetratricopeptide (TPR) repeat protein
MQTSYSLISIYKQRITALDRAIHQPPRQNAQQPQPQPSRAVEYRRLLQRFRQFLSEEEKFWTQLVLRFRRHFAIDESQPALTALGIVPEEESVPSADGTGRRNQYQFPPESEPGNMGAVAPMSQAQRESRVAIISKALVCLGDIARYKELYNEAGGRPRAGHEDGPPAAASTTKNGRSRRGGGPAQVTGMVALPRLRNYDRAQSCYEQARLLLPFDGNPSHQLAILASYQKDIFGSLVHYYRALCVRTPYETASENLGTVLNKAFEQYKAKGLVREQEKQAEIASGAPAVPRLRVEAFKEKVVVLHSMWSMNNDECVPFTPNLHSVLT